MLHALKNAADEGWNRLISLFVNRGEKEKKKNCCLNVTLDLMSIMGGGGGGELSCIVGESRLILDLLKNLSTALLNTL